MTTWFERLDPEQRTATLTSIDTPAGREAVAYDPDAPREFHAWLTAANLLCIESHGISLFELNDIAFRVHFDDGLTPHDALTIAIAETSH